MKRVFIIVAIVSLLFLVSLQVFVYFSQPTSTEELETRVGTLPELTLTGIDDHEFKLTPGKSTVLIYFNSDCDHCQREIAALREKPELFAEASLVLMSAQPLQEIQTFASTIDFGTADARFVHVSHEQIATVFGTLGLPHIFVYSKEGKLMEIFSGETPPEAIAKVLTP